MLLTVGWGGVPPLRAQDASDTLQEAVRLFGQGDYLAAQEKLVKLDRSKLSADEQALRDDYLTRVQVALTMYEKAQRDLEDAETAIDEGEIEQARRLLRGVLANEYAAAAVRKAATAHLRSLKGKKSKTQTPPSSSPAATGTERAPTEEKASPEAQPERGKEKGEEKPAEQRVPGKVTPEAVEQAKTLTEAGDAAMKASRFEEARQRYEEALRLVPGFPEAVKGLQRLRDHQAVAAGEPSRSLLERIRMERRINWQRAVTEYRDLDRMIRGHVQGHRFEEAHQALIRARQVVEASRQYADPVTKYESLRNELETLQQFVEEEERRYNEEQVARVRREVEEQRRRQLEEVKQRRARQVEMLMKQAMQHRKDGDLDAAINVLKQVVAIDPKNRPARWTLDMLVDMREMRIGRELRDDLYRETQRALNDVERSKIPWSEETQRYPDNWLEIISRPERRRVGENRPGGRLYGLLDKKVPVDFEGTPFDQVIERLASEHGLNIIVNWNDLKRAGVDRKTPIELSLPRQITLKRVLNETLEQAGAGLVELGFDAREGAIKIATRATLDRQTYTAVYDINDLLMEVPNFNDAPVSDLNRANSRAIRAQQADRPWKVGDDDDDEPEDDPERTDRVQKIIDLIEDTIAPDSWIDRGGTVGTIREINGQLVVTQSSAAQRQIGNLLGKLREQRAIQIAIEARFISVSSHYLEELGVDIDLVLNSGNAGFDFVPTGQGPLTDPVLGNVVLLPRTFSRLGFVPTTPALGNQLQQTPAQLAQPFGQPVLVPQRSGGASGSRLTPLPIINQVTSFTAPTNLGSDVPGSFAGQPIGPAFSLFGSFLDNIQVDFLIRATEADSRTNVLTAPRLVLFNGQRSWVAVTIQQNFVSQLNPVVATGAVAQAPQTATIDSGAVLDVAATVTADRRYVNMTLRPGLTRLLDLQTIPFSGGGAGGGFGGGTALNAFIQLPTLSSQRVQTTVSVPDGGTLLIGGQKLASETEVEAGVPILSKIPILKRAYQSRSMVKDEQTLLILVKPKILIQTEQEQLAFPSFGQE